MSDDDDVENHIQCCIVEGGVGDHFPVVGLHLTTDLVVGVTMHVQSSQPGDRPAAFSQMFESQLKFGGKEARQGGEYDQVVGDNNGKSVRSQ